MGRGWRVVCVLWANGRCTEDLAGKKWEEGRGKGEESTLVHLLLVFSLEVENYCVGKRKVGLACGG